MAQILLYVMGAKSSIKSFLIWIHPAQHRQKMLFQDAYPVAHLSCSIPVLAVSL